MSWIGLKYAEKVDHDQYEQIGTFRHSWETFQFGSGDRQCSCGQILHNEAEDREHWEAGHFDQPVYQIKSTT